MSNSSVAAFLISFSLGINLDLLKVSQIIVVIAKKKMCGLSLNQSGSWGVPTMSVARTLLSRLAACCQNHVFFLTAWPEFFFFTTDFIRSRVGGGEIILEEVTDSARQEVLALSVCLRLPADSGISLIVYWLHPGWRDENLKWFWGGKGYR